MLPTEGVAAEYLLHDEPEIGYGHSGLPGLPRAGGDAEALDFLGRVGLNFALANEQARFAADPGPQEWKMHHQRSERLMDQQWQTAGSARI